MDEFKIMPYSGAMAVAYANKWGLFRNPLYLDFSQLGGDCTNFISQCIYAGSHIMNYKPVNGWYYTNADNRAAAWTGVDFLYKFLTTNQGDGPFGHEICLCEAQLGDIIQLSNDTSYYHSLIVTDIIPNPYNSRTVDNILVSAHSFDALNRELSSYLFDSLRCIRIDGVRKIL